MLIFAAAVAFLIITPGPGVLSAAGIGSAFGYRLGVTYVAGLFIGTNAVALAVVTGSAALVLGIPYVREILAAASILYLTYLAVRIALAGSKVAFITSEKPPGVLGGIMLQIINPKAYAVNTTLFTNFEFWPANPIIQVLSKLLIINMIWIPIHIAWLAAGVTVKRMELSNATQRKINVGMAVAMMLVVLLAAYSNI